MYNSDESCMKIRDVIKLDEIDIETERKMMGEHKKRMEELRRIISFANTYNVDIKRLKELYGKTEPCPL